MGEGVGERGVGWSPRPIFLAVTISRVTFLLLCTNTSLDAEQTVRSDYSPLNCRDLLTVCCSVELTPARASVLAGFPRPCAIRSSFFFTKTPWLPGNVWTRVLFKKDFTKKKGRKRYEMQRCRDGKNKEGTCRAQHTHMDDYAVGCP